MNSFKQWIHTYMNSLKKNEIRKLRKFGLNSPGLWIRVNTHPILDWTIHWFNWWSCHCIKRHSNCFTYIWKARYGSFLIIVHWNFSIALIHCSLNSSKHFWEDNISVKMALTCHIDTWYDIHKPDVEICRKYISLPMNTK